MLNLLRRLLNSFARRPATACCTGNRTIHWANFR